MEKALEKLSAALSARRKAKAIKQSELPSPGRLSSLEAGAGVYSVIYADPPWCYNDRNCHGATGPHYDTMTLDRLKALPVGGLAHVDGCALWLWTTWPMIRDKAPHEVLDAWGFEWKSEVVWNKVNYGVGRWLRLQTEVLIFAIKEPFKLANTNQRDYLEAKSTKHSIKPEEARGIIEELCPDGRRIELFARKATVGWDRWGDEA